MPKSSQVDFAKDIRPLLSDRCFLCHGPAEEGRATDLRLDLSESAHELAIEPGDPESSELMARITSTDPDVIMPPPDSNLSLSAEDVEVLRRWIADGAEYEGHWAFQTPTQPPIPATTSKWPNNPIDNFVLKRLETEKLPPQQLAAPETLLRRIALDLTGLPPTPEELDAFLAEPSLKAYEAWIDTYMSRSSFGEKWAIDWLDVARYADTYGYQNDKYRAMWPWRDWVVSALNDNLPYDQFITWQLAGDLLPDASKDQVLATAFNRNHRQTNEGGSVEEEFRAEYVADRVNTFGAAFLGLTLECCRCHDHKYDPISQADYYSLSAFFNSIDESGLYPHFNSGVPTPTLRLADGQTVDKMTDLEKAIEDIESQRKALPQTGFDAWRAALGYGRKTGDSSSPLATAGGEKEPASDSLKETLNKARMAGLVGHYTFDTIDGVELKNEVQGGPAGTLNDAPEKINGQIGSGVRLDGENGFSLKTGGEFSRNAPFSIQIWMRSPKEFERAVVFHRSKAWTDSASRGYELLIEDGKLSFALVHFWPGNAARIRAQTPMPINQWQHVTLTYDGSCRASGMKIMVDGLPVEVDVVRDSLTKTIAGAAKELAFGNRFRDIGFKGGEVDEIRIYERQLTPLEIRYHYLVDAMPEAVDEWLRHLHDEQLAGFYAANDANQLALQRRLAERRTELSKLQDAIPEIMVMRELPAARPTHVLMRGAYDSLGEPVERSVPNAIFEKELSPQPTRLDLANWLTDPAHPLTARVAVNRIWQTLFGSGLVRTSEDFGLQGSAPTHPGLLDWLACRYSGNGWDTKALIKTILMSATYRQSSDPTPELLRRDPQNTFLARGPAVRLSAEALRDSVLAAGDILVDRMGGPPVKPYQPAGLWKEKSGQVYNRDVGEGSHRKSLYTYWKRTSPPPSMMTFDASNREVCVVRRQATSTPMQALVLLNDPQFVEAARALSNRVMNQADGADAQLALMFRLLTSRVPSPAESAALKDLLNGQMAYFQRLPAERDAFLAIGDFAASGSEAEVNEERRNQLAGLAAVAGGLMSYDEFIMKR